MLFSHTWSHRLHQLFMPWQLLWCWSLVGLHFVHKTSPQSGPQVIGELLQLTALIFSTSSRRSVELIPCFVNKAHGAPSHQMWGSSSYLPHQHSTSRISGALITTDGTARLLNARDVTFWMSKRIFRLREDEMRMRSWERPRWIEKWVVMFRHYAEMSAAEVGHG